jgi:hypothetical protein
VLLYGLFVERRDALERGTGRGLFPRVAVGNEGSADGRSAGDAHNGGTGDFYTDGPGSGRCGRLILRVKVRDSEENECGKILHTI